MNNYVCLYLSIIAQYMYDEEDVGYPYIQSTTLLCDTSVAAGTQPTAGGNIGITSLAEGFHNEQF